jgi:hypothetical protein
MYRPYEQHCDGDASHGYGRAAGDRTAMTTDKEKFDATMKKVLSVSKQELQRRIEEEKKAKAKSKQV